MSATPSRTAPTRGRLVAFAVLVVACAAGAGVSVLSATLGGNGSTSDVHVAAVRVGTDIPAQLSGKGILVRAVDGEDPGLNGHVTVTRLGGSPKATQLGCQRVYFAGGRGICLALSSSGIDYRAVVFDRRFREVHALSLDGIPSRARVSPDGRLGAVTSFVTGHSYAEANQFSTSTRLLDLKRGRWLANLEEFEVVRNGRRINAPDFNFWGVTFETGGRGFYATLSTGEHRYLVHGDLARRRVEVLRDRVECPSLSPSGQRIAYKRTLGGGRWRLHVVDLETGADRPLAETRSIDDQVEWLDNRFVLYGDGRDVFVARADGSGHPRRVLRDAASPAALN